MGIHINKSPATWRDKFNHLNMIVPDRVDDNMLIFKASDDSVGDSEDEDSPSIIGSSQGSQYDGSNDPLSTVDETSFIKSGNVILWHIQARYDKFDKNAIFPVLYREDPNADPIVFKPIFFAMFPHVIYDKITDKIYLTFWNNVKEHTGGPQESFAYRPFYNTDDTGDKNYQIGSVISIDDTTASTGTYRRALFACEGSYTKYWWNCELKFGGNTYNSDRDYYQQGAYIFNKPIIAFLPEDSTDNIVVDIGAGGGSQTFFGWVDASE